MLDSKPAGEEPADCKPSANSAALSHAHRKIKHPTGLCKRDVTQKAVEKPLQNTPCAALSTHVVGETAGVRPAKGKAA